MIVSQYLKERISRVIPRRVKFTFIQVLHLYEYGWLLLVGSLKAKQLNE